MRRHPHVTVRRARLAMRRCTRTSQRPNEALRRSATPAPSAQQSCCHRAILWSRRDRRNSPRGSKGRARAQTLIPTRPCSLRNMQRPPMPRRHTMAPHQRQQHLLLYSQPKRTRAGTGGHLSVMRRAWYCHQPSAAPLPRPALREPTAADNLWLWRSRPGGSRPVIHRLHRPQFPRRQQATARCRKRSPSSGQNSDVRAWRVPRASKTLSGRRRAVMRTVQQMLLCRFSSPRSALLM